MSQGKDAQEPSMEEILSSIRRIIADEEKDRSAAGAPAPSFATADDDVLELTDVADDVPGTPAPASTPPTPAAEAAPAIANEPIKEMSNVAVSKDDSLVSAGAASASTNAFSKLARAVATDDRPATAATGRSVDDLLAELLRPMLKEWLDQNLAGVVERVVEQEVKKLARRAELM
jgi:cell pole-organizing protein PopZ